MSSPLMISNHGGIHVVRFVHRDILDAIAIERISRELQALVNAAPEPEIVISFRNVDNLSSAAIGALITVNAQIQAKNGQLRLSGISDDIHKMFQITKLDKLFKIHPTSGQALASIRPTTV